jgi:hypothetical protein
MQLRPVNGKEKTLRMLRSFSPLPEFYNRATNSSRWKMSSFGKCV